MFQQFARKTAMLFHGPGGAQAANVLAYGELVRQATLLSFMDAFRWMAGVCLVCGPLVLFFKKAKAPAGAHVLLD